MIFKRFIKQVLPSCVIDSYRKYSYVKKKNFFIERNPKEIFTQLYKSEHWMGIDGESVSGPGSSFQQSKSVITGIEQIIDEFEIKSILDIPCGDFNWMKHVSLNGISYIGADIVSELIKKNKENFQTDNLQFKELDLLKSKLPIADLIICRDCLVHFSNDMIFQSLNNIKHSPSKYVLLTTFKKQRVNYNIDTGSWRPINFERKPFSFPSPILYIDELIPEKFKKESKGKSLGLWRVSDII